MDSQKPALNQVNLNGTTLDETATAERIVRRRQLSRELVGGIDEGVIGIHEVLAGLILRARLQPLAAGGGHVLEHAAALKHARDLDDVVLAVGAKQSELPVAATAGSVDVAAQSRLARTSDHLLKRRIRYQESFDQTRLQRIGAAELERRRYTVRFRVSGIERHPLRENFVGQTRHWIETGVGETGAEIGAGAEQIGHVDGGEIVTSPRSQRQTVGQIERFVEIGTIIGLPRGEADGAEADIGGGVDNLSGPRDRSVRTGEEIRVNETELAVSLESDLAAIDSGADHEVVLVTEHLVVVEALQQRAGRQRLGEGAVDRAPGRRGACIPVARRARDRLVVRVEDLETRLRKACWKSIVLEAQGVEQRIGPIAAAALDLGGVAVDMLLVEPAIIKIALHRPMVGHGVAAVERNQFRLVFGGLRPGVNRAIVVGEQFDWCRSDRAEEIVRCGRDEMNLGVGALPAEIPVEARQPRWRLEAPAVVLETFRREIEPPFPVAHAVLQGAADPTVGAA